LANLFEQSVAPIRSLGQRFQAAGSAHDAGAHRDHHAHVGRRCRMPPGRDAQKYGTNLAPGMGASIALAAIGHAVGVDRAARRTMDSGASIRFNQ
jgi:hypothetical protein